MEFEINVQHGLNGHVEITDYSKEYDLYYPENAEGMSATDKFKYSLSNSVNVITRVNTDKVTLVDVLLDKHTDDKEQLIFDVDRDGYFTIAHFVIPTEAWVLFLLTSPTSLIKNYSTIYYTKGDELKKRVVLVEDLGDRQYKYSLDEEQDVTVRELLERNVEGTTIQKCKIDIFYTGYLQECYINHCRDLFHRLMSSCRPNCNPLGLGSFPRDFLWMSLNVMDYLIERNQFLEALRILEEINYCGGFCNNVNNDESLCGCNQGNARTTCGCSQR